MGLIFKRATSFVAAVIICSMASAQKAEMVNVVKVDSQMKVNIFIGGKFFTAFWYTDTLEKPVLYPVNSASGTTVTRGFPLKVIPNEPTDHPHHIGIWFNFENVNGLDFWNNSFAIPPEKKHLYGWIRTDHILEASGGAKGILSYHANWTNQQKDILLEETTRFEFSGTAHQRTIDRITVLKADTGVFFADAKDGLLGVRVAHELQIPAVETRKYTDDKGNVTEVKGDSDIVANGNYITSEGKQGDSAWSTRAAWCKMYAKMGSDSISITIIDHPRNPNYPTFWHARGYGLFAANPLGEKIFTNGKSAKDLRLKKGESVTFIYRIIVQDGKNTPAPEILNASAVDFSKRYNNEYHQDHLTPQ